MVDEGVDEAAGVSDFDEVSDLVLSVFFSADRTGEIQLTNGLRQLLKKRPIYAVEIDGVRHDTGNKLGFLKALVYFALKRPELAGPFRQYLEKVHDLKAPAL